MAAASYAEHLGMGRGSQAKGLAFPCIQQVHQSQGGAKSDLQAHDKQIRNLQAKDQGHDRHPTSKAPDYEHGEVCPIYLEAYEAVLAVQSGSGWIPH